MYGSLLSVMVLLRSRRPRQVSGLRPRPGHPPARVAIDSSHHHHRPTNSPGRHCHPGALVMRRHRFSTSTSAKSQKKAHSCLLTCVRRHVCCLVRQARRLDIEIGMCSLQVPQIHRVPRCVAPAST
ncbi:uncharacterized protein BKA78DRAFT_302202 [Phyllosticta capitalensis]|uniref:uncharacterized protein n=1 Tax=Phyllosticta capitalensis TaxID=121624 RepID=UPI00313027E2